MTKSKIYSAMVAVLIAAATFSGKAQDTSSFKPSGSVYGQFFVDFQYKANTPDSLNLSQGRMQYSGSTGSYKDAHGSTIPIPIYPTNYSSFEIRRVYLGYKYNFTERVVADVLLAHENNVTLDQSGQRTVYIKAANIRYKNLFKGTDVIFGQQQTPAYATFSEAIYGFRFIEKTITDMRGVVPSNDLGVALQGKYSDGKYGYTVMMGNDNAARPENDNFKRFYGEVWGRFLNKRLNVHLYADDKLVQLSANSALTVNPGSTIQGFTKSQMTYKGFVAWQTSRLTAGVEAFSANLQNYSYTMDTAASASNKIEANRGDTTLRDAMPFGVSVFASYYVIKDKLALFARYDMIDPDKNFDVAYKYLSGSVNYSKTGVYSTSHIQENFISVGIDYIVAKNFHVSPNVWYNGYKETALIMDPTVADKTQAGNTRQETGYDLDYRLTVFLKF